MNFEELVGRTIKSVTTDTERTHLCFHTDAEALLYYAEGDCCSESWFNHIVNAEALIGATVTSIDVAEERSIDNGDSDFSGKQDVDSIYGFTIHTTKGSCQIELRNSSNGYYGGWVHRVKAEETAGCQKHEDCRKTPELGIACAGGVWRIYPSGKSMQVAVPMTADF